MGGGETAWEPCFKAPSPASTHSDPGLASVFGKHDGSTLVPGR